MPLVVPFMCRPGGLHVALESSLSPGEAAADRFFWHGVVDGPGRLRLEPRAGVDRASATRALEDPRVRIYLQVDPQPPAQRVLRSLDGLRADRGDRPTPVLFVGALPDDPARGIEPPRGILRILEEAGHSRVPSAQPSVGDAWTRMER